jgi:murein DD-endopeptidase MepM/ murein hydrolase activator NlpD
MRRQGIVIFTFIATVVTVPVLAQGWRHQSAESDKDRAQAGATDSVACAIGRWRNCDIQQAVARGLFETGLRPVFPAHAKCRGIDEGYAISYTAKRGREQYHGGIDMPAPWGTPMIAAATGTVVGKFHGERSFRGIEIVLRHSPDDTGIPLWIYTQYAHCSKMPALELGQRVRIGEHICPTGNTGIDRTGAQSTRRRPAIHFAVFFSTSERYEEIQDVIIPAEGYWMDPVALFRKTLPLDSNSMKALPEAEKQVPVSIMFENGETFPAGTRIVWPYTCTRM